MEEIMLQIFKKKSIWICCIFLGVAICFLGFALTGFQIDAFSDEFIFDKIFLEDLKKIDVIAFELGEESILIKESDSDQVLFHFQEGKYDVDITEDGVLTIKNKADYTSYNWYHIFWWYRTVFLQRQELVLEIPKQFFGNLELKGDVLKVTSLGAFKWNSFLCNMKEGKIELDSLEVVNDISVLGNDVDLKISKLTSHGITKVQLLEGSVIADKIESQKLYVVTKKGNVKIGVDGVMEDYTVTTTQEGKQNVDRRDGGKKEIVIDIINGNIDLKFLGE